MNPTQENTKRPAVVSLQKKDWDKIRTDFTKTEMMSEEEINILATKLNARVDLPFVREDTEQVIAAKIIRRIDRFLQANLPVEIYSVVRSAEGGFTEDEITILKERFTAIANGIINIPYVPEALERTIISFVLNQIFNAMRKGVVLAEDKINEPATTTEK